MNCATARSLMLEADLADLAPGAGTELGAHLAACAVCRGAADEIRGLEAGLAAWLAAQRPRGDAAAALARAAAAARRRARVRRAGTVLSLAVAAVLAGLLVLPHGPGRRPVPPVARPVAAGFSVVAGPGRDVMIMQPADPNIVVVWYLPSRRSS